MPQPEPRQRAQTQTLDDAVLGVIAEHGGLAPGEMVVHFDIVAAVDVLDDEGRRLRTDRRHWPMRGSDPHISESYLRATAERIFRGKLVGEF